MKTPHVLRSDKQVLRRLLTTHECFVSPNVTLTWNLPPGWKIKCHSKINPLGLPFERYDHFGRYRIDEFYAPVETTGPTSSRKEA